MGDLQNEVFDLQSKLSKLESLMTQKKQPSKPVKKAPLSRKRSTSRNSASAHLLKTLEAAENEIKSMERSLTPSRRGNNGSYKKELKQQKDITQRLLKENELMRKKLEKTEDMNARVSKLQEDYKVLAASFERSENVRKRQK